MKVITLGKVRAARDSSGPRKIKQEPKSALVRPRPHGFIDYIAEHGFHSVYLVTTAHGSPLKVGIAQDPVRRLVCLQNANFEQLRFHRFWWVSGRPIAARIEQAFKKHFAPDAIRGEWFNVSLSAAEAFIAESIRSLATWGIGQDDMLKLMEQWVHRRVERSLGPITHGRGLVEHAVNKGKRPIL
jgi:hypothetical protein